MGYSNWKFQKSFKILYKKAHKWQVGFRVLYLQTYITLLFHNRCFESRYCRKVLQIIFQQILALFQTLHSNLKNSFYHNVVKEGGFLYINSWKARFSVSNCSINKTCKCAIRVFYYISTMLISIPRLSFGENLSICNIPSLLHQSFEVLIFFFCSSYHERRPRVDTS